MKRFPFILVLVITVLSGCSNTDNLSFDTVQSRVIGKWTIHKVKLLDNRRLFSSNITDIYKDFTFEYKADNTLEVFNARENKLLQGIWYLDEIWSWDGIKGESLIFCTKDFKNPKNEVQKIVETYINEEFDEKKHTFKIKDEYVFFNYNMELL